MNPQKCVFGKSTLNFLDIESHPRPFNHYKIVCKSTDSFLNQTLQQLLNNIFFLYFYRRFVPHELAKVKDKDFGAAWTTQHTQHFQQSKYALAAATCLAHPSPTAETRLQTDASDTAVGTVFEQLRRYGRVYLLFEEVTSSESQVLRL